MIDNCSHLNLIR